MYFFTRGNSPNLAVFDRLGGFVFYGGLIGAIVGLYIYSKQRWNRFLDLLDTYASIFPLGQAIRNNHPDDIEMWLIDFKMTEFMVK